MNDTIERNAPDVGRLCTRAVVAIDAAASLRDAARLMRTEHVGALVVTTEFEERRAAMGLVTDRDIADAVAATHMAVGEVYVGAIASRPLLSVDATASPAEAAAVMCETGVRRLAVMARDGTIVGLLSSDDLLAALIEPLQALAEAFRVGIAREHVSRAGASSPPPRPVFLPMGTPGMRA